jgi:Co/Zn/Cd efflux system component
MTALYLTRQKASNDYTYGWHRSEIIGTIMSIVFLLALTLWLVVEAFKRIFLDYEIDGDFMLITAVLSLLFNIVMLETLHDVPGHDHDHDHGHDHGHSHGHGHSHEGGHSHGHSHAHSHDDKKMNSLKKSAN